MGIHIPMTSIMHIISFSLYIYYNLLDFYTVTRPCELRLKKKMHVAMSGGHFEKKAQVLRAF